VTPWWTALRRRAPAVRHDLSTWWAWHREVRADIPLARAALAAARADRLSSAFISGYQAALEALFSERHLAALAVTEAGGNHPRAMETTHSGGRLSGTKTFVTGGRAAEILWVVAREGGSARRPKLVVARVRSDAPGLHWRDGPDMPFVPELAHGVLTLDQAPVDAMFDGDGYAEVVKPFRTVEDLHVLAACLGFAIGEAARHRHPDEAWTEDALALLATVNALASQPADATAAHLALASVFRQAGPLLDAGPWEGEARERWERDRPLLGVAGEVRDRRRQRAWESWR